MRTEPRKDVLAQYPRLIQAAEAIDDKQRLMFAACRLQNRVQHVVHAFEKRCFDGQDRHSVPYQLRLEEREGTEVGEHFFRRFGEG